MIAALGPSWRVQVVTHAECAMVDQPTATGADPGKRNPGWYAHRDFTLSWVAAQRPDLVVSSDEWNFAASIVGRPRDSLANQDLWDEGLTSLMTKLASVTKLVALEQPYPTPNLQFCGGSGDPTPKVCTSQIDDVASAMVSGEQSEVTAAGGTYVLSDDWTCSDGACPAVIAGHPVMWDGAHLTTTFSEYLAPKIRAALAKAGVRDLAKS